MVNKMNYMVYLLALKKQGIVFNDKNNEKQLINYQFHNHFFNKKLQRFALWELLAPRIKNSSTQRGSDKKKSPKSHQAPRRFLFIVLACIRCI